MCGVPALQSVVINKCLVAYPDSNPNPLLPAKLISFLPVRIALFAGTAMALPFRLQSSHCPFSGVRIARFYLATMAFIPLIICIRVPLYFILVYLHWPLCIFSTAHYSAE